MSEKKDNKWCLQLDKMRIPKSFIKASLMKSWDTWGFAVMLVVDLYLGHKPQWRI